jgi:hypothetical protein
VIARADDAASSDNDPRADALRFCAEWPERSLSAVPEPEALSTVPHQPTPDHDDVPEIVVDVTAGSEGADTPAPFERPPSREIDFARVVRRADLCRTATRTAQVSTGATGLLLIVFLLTSSRVLLALALLAVAALSTSVAVRLRLAAAPIPYLPE